MICTVIQNKGLDGILEALEHCEMAEIRLDRCRLSDEDIMECFSSDVPLVATCRLSDVMAANPGMSDAEAVKICEKRLMAAIDAGAGYVDIEMEAPKEMSKRVRSRAHSRGTVFIKSYHDFNTTDSLVGLKSIVEKCRYYGGDIVKVVTTAHSEEDADRVLSLYDIYTPASLIAFCMGDKGKRSRVGCLAKGAPYTYAAMSEEDIAAPGQWAASAMAEAVYGGRKFIGYDADFMKYTASDIDDETGSGGQIRTGEKDGTYENSRGAGTGKRLPVRMPASKSFAQRAILAAALAEGESRLDGYSPCSDSEAAISVARAIGAEVTKVHARVPETEESADADGNAGQTTGGRSEVLIIKGIGAAPGCVDIDRIDVGESGLLTRLMIPLSAILSSSDVTVEGRKTLLGRPMKGADEMLAAFGVHLSSDHVPLTVRGCLEGGNASVSGRNGSQLISGLLMALPMAEGRSTVTVTSPKSIPYMFITLDVMKHFGVKVSNEMSGGRAFLESGGDWTLCTEMTFNIKGGQKYRASGFSLEGDWSAAANFLVAGAVFGRTEIAGLDMTSLQADLSIMDILVDAGASLSQTDGDQGIICVQRAPLTAFVTDVSHCPDLFPIVSVLAAFCQGRSRIAGVDRLAHKESDRGQAILQMLSQMGVEASVEGNAMIIEGYPLAQRCLTGRLLKGGKYTSWHDHRMVMALKVAGLGADSRIEIDDEECVGKSFPDFMERFSMIVQ